MTGPRPEQDPMLRLQYYKETGQTDLAGKYEQYLRETNQYQEPKAAAPTGKHDFHAEYASGALAKRMAAENAKDVEDAEPGFIEKAAAHGANIAQGIPGMGAVEAGVGAAASRLPGMGKPLSYRESYNALQDATSKIPTSIRLAERVAGGVPLAAVLPGGPVAGGALLGAADPLLSGNPDKSLGERVPEAALGAGVGALTGKAAEYLVGASRARGAGDPNANVTSFMKQARTASKPGYKAFRDLGDLQGPPELDDIMELPIVRRAVETVKGESPALAKLPDTDARVLDAIYKRIGKRAFNAVHGFEPGEARNALFDAIQQAAEAKGGSYAEPVSTFRNFAQQASATLKGKKALNAALSPSGGTPANSPEALTEWLQNAQRSATEQQAALQGVLGQANRRGLASTLGGLKFHVPIPFPSAALRKATSLVGQFDPTLGEDALRLVAGGNALTANP